MSVAAANHTLTVTRIGTSTGTVTSTPAGINCGATCSASLSGTVTLAPVPGGSAVFGGWSGDPDCADGSVTMDADKTCTAAFNTKPDLVVSVLGAPTTAAQGQVIAVTDTTQNSNTGGPAYPGISVTRFYLSVDATLGAGDVEIGSRAVPQLGPSASSAGSTNVTIPAGTAAGSYSIIAMADAGNAVPETNEGSNTRSRSITIGPDLSVSALSAPASSGAGLAITINDTTKDAGNAAQAPASTTGFYLSVDGLLDAGDTPLGGRAVPALAPGATSASSTTVTIPIGTLSGVYSIIASSDDAHSISETVETNNTKVVSITIGPDAIVSALTAPGNVSRGATVSISSTTKNQAGGSTGVSSSTKFYFSTDTVLDGGDTLLGTRSIPVLAPGAADASSISVTIPNSLPPCTTNICSLIAVADANTQVQETDETNNIRVKGMKIN